MGRRNQMHRRIHSEDVGLQIAPMIDITLLLLFFFMLSNSIVRTDSRGELDLPIATSSKNSNPEFDSHTLTLDVDKSGRWFVGSETIEPHLLKSFLQNKSTLRLRADARTPAETIQRIVQTAADSGVQAIHHGIHQPEN